MSNENHISIFNSDAGDIEVNIDAHNETVWLSLQDISALFERDKSVISRHLKNIYDSHELDRISTVAKNATVQIEGSRKIQREIDYYNLDAIISVGYRVNSKKGVQFRQWANKILKDYLVQGYALNEKKLKEQSYQIKQLEKTLALIQSVEYDQLSQSESSGLLTVLSEYTHSFILLNQYDSDSLNLDHLNDKVTYSIDYLEALGVIKQLKQKLMAKNEATELFGNQKDNSFEGLIGNVMQSFAGEYLYPSVEEQAAHLLYFIIKNHPFSDGNKRIGAFMFVWFLEKNKHQLKANGEYKISDNALVAIALLVAQSDPSQKEVIIKLVINLIKNER